MLRSARETMKLSQKKLAKKLNISQSYLSQLENREKYNKNVTIGLMKKISEELKLNPIDVFLYFLKSK